jgi:hypothetical protein
MLMFEPTAPALARSIRTVKLAKLAQFGAVLGTIVILLEGWVMADLLLCSDIPVSDQSQLILAIAGLGNYGQSSSSLFGLWLIAAIYFAPRALILAALTQLLSFLRSAPRNAVPASQTASCLRRFGVLLAMSAVVSIVVLPLAWAVAFVGNPFAQEHIPFRIGSEHILLLLSSLTPIALASIMRDAAEASEDARSII